MRSLNCVKEISGWRLHLARLTYEKGDFDGVMNIAKDGSITRLQKRFVDKSIKQDETINAIKNEFKRLGISPDIYPLIPETLAKNVVGGREFTKNNPSYDLVNILMLETMLPWNVIDYSKVQPPLKFHLSKEWKSLLPQSESEPKTPDIPVLSDEKGVIGTPFSEHGAFRITPDVSDLLYVCYIPEILENKVKPSSILARIVVQTWAFRFRKEARI